MYNKVLVPLDGSEFGECSLAHVKAIAQGCKTSKIILLEVLGLQQQESYLRSAMGEDFMKQLKENARKDAVSYLNKTADALKDLGISIETVVEDGMPAEAILDYAKKENVDLIIMSTHGRSGVVKWALGSVADHVIRHATAPVFLVAPKVCRVS